MSTNWFTPEIALTSKASDPATGLATDLFQYAARAETSGDASASTGTRYTARLGDTFNGSLSSPSDHDWVKIYLNAGQSYVFTVWGRDGNINGLDDPTLTLRDSSGNAVRFNDDVSGNSLFPAITVTPSRSGTYYLDVGSAADSGRYTLQIASNTYSVSQVVNQITKYGWGVPSVLRHDERSGDTMTVNIANLTADGQKLALWALEAWEQASGLNFVTTTSSGADILFDDESAGAFAGPNSYYPSNGQIIQSTVNVSKAWLSTYGHSLDSYSMLTYIHEIGHALGLAHAGPYDGSASFPSDALFRNDSYQMTVMSYFNTATNTAVNASYGLPVTAMLADIAAMRALYGHPGTVQGGNTVWGANSNVTGYMGQLMGFLFDGDALDPAIYAGGPVMFTIQDTGGIDTLDLSHSSVSQRISLRQGAASNTLGRTGNLQIAQGTVIENVIGGNGRDLIMGNSIGNTITPGRGNDAVNGAGGVDLAILGAALSSITVDRIDGKLRIVSADGTDVFQNVERFQFDDAMLSAGQLYYGRIARDLVGTAQNDTLRGGYRDDTVKGNGGADYLIGFFGDDTVGGGAGNDSVFGGSGDDRLSGNKGHDRILGHSGADWLSGSYGHDTLYGGGGQDTLYGGQGDDSLIGGDDSDVVSGGNGADRAYGSSGNDTLLGGDGNDSLFGGDDDDIVSGGDGSDWARGNDGNDSVQGGNGDDTVDGGAGNDTIDGGYGNDTAYGGSGADEFIFATNPDEYDRIEDFEDGIDHIEISGASGYAVFDVAEGAEIRFDGHTVLLVGVSSADIDGSDLLLV